MCPRRSGAELGLHSIIKALVTRRHVEHQELGARNRRAIPRARTCAGLRVRIVTQTTGHCPYDPDKAVLPVRGRNIILRCRMCEEMRSGGAHGNGPDAGMRKYHRGFEGSL